MNLIQGCCSLCVLHFWYGFQLSFCAIAYSVCLQNKTIITDGDTIIPKTSSFYSYDFSVANDVAVH